MDGLVKQQGHRRPSRHRRKDSGGLLLCRWARCSPIYPVKRSRRRRSNGHRHRIGLKSFLLARVGALGELGGLGDSNGGGASLSQIAPLPRQVQAWRYSLRRRCSLRQQVWARCNPDNSTSLPLRPRTPHTSHCCCIFCPTCCAVVLRVVLCFAS
jgi:hypothetical protein